MRYRTITSTKMHENCLDLQIWGNEMIFNQRLHTRWIVVAHNKGQFVLGRLAY
jgi:hypothetical protein